MFVLVESRLSTARKVPEALSSAGTVEFRACVREATVRIEAALIAAEMLAAHGVVESLSYERLIDSLYGASKAVDDIDTRLVAASGRSPADDRGS
jgi:hypothetical protein